MDFRVVRDEPRRPWARLAERLGGRGVRDLEHELHELALEPVLTPMRALLDSNAVRALAEALAAPRVRRGRGAAAHPASMPAPDAAPSFAAGATRLSETVARFASVARVVHDWTGLRCDGPEAIQRFGARIAELVRHVARTGGVPIPEQLALGFARVVLLALAGEDEAGAARAATWLHEWRWGGVVAELARGLGAGEEAVGRAVPLLEVVLLDSGVLRRELMRKDGVRRALAAWTSDESVRSVVRVHEYDGVLWFHRESWEAMIEGLCSAVALDAALDPDASPASRARRALAARRTAAPLLALAHDAGYRWNALFEPEPAVAARRPS